MTAPVVYRANQWVWWSISVAGYRHDWRAARQARYERDLSELIGVLADLMNGRNENPR